jgi:Holliday junction DNA helicase RuvA
LIARLTGTVAHVEANIIILDVSGVGYKVAVPVTALDSIGGVGAQTSLEIHTAVREDDISLYGFPKMEQRKAFELLIGVSGIGPKVALSILSAIDVPTLVEAVAAEDTRTLVKVPGLGLKTAQKLLLEVKDKMAVLSYERRIDKSHSTLPIRRPLQDTVRDDVEQGLVGLGFNKNEARRAAERALTEISDPSNPTMALKFALNLLTGGK